MYPKMSMVANNLAWLLTFSEPHDYPRALQIMDELLKHFPDSPVFHETRGEVLVKLGRWHDAVTDLEYALPWHKDNPRTHSALAQAYAALGMKDLAAEHQRLAQSTSAAKAH
jgi:predicted Zn-dependent protease